MLKQSQGDGKKKKKKTFSISLLSQEPEKNVEKKCQCY
jgi:hypothetical protein